MICSLVVLGSIAIGYPLGNINLYCSFLGKLANAGDAFVLEATLTAGCIGKGGVSNLAEGGLADLMKKYYD